MKYLRRLLFVGLIVGYFLWPYHAVKKLASAVEAGEGDTVLSMIDSDALADSMKDLAVEAALLAAEDRAAGNPFDKEGMRTQLRQMLERSSFKAISGNQMPAIISRLTMDSRSATRSAAWDARIETWLGPMTFAVQEPGSEARAIFKFRGTGWKLAGLEVPADEIRRYMPAVSSAQPRPATWGRGRSPRK